MADNNTPMKIKNLTPIDKQILRSVYLANKNSSKPSVWDVIPDDKKADKRAKRKHHQRTRIMIRAGYLVNITNNDKTALVITTAGLAELAAFDEAFLGEYASQEGFGEAETANTVP